MRFGRGCVSGRLTVRGRARSESYKCCDKNDKNNCDDTPNDTIPSIRFPPLRRGIDGDGVPTPVLGCLDCENPIALRGRVQPLQLRTVTTVVLDAPETTSMSTTKEALSAPSSHWDHLRRAVWALRPLIDYFGRHRSPGCL